jgi:hypothetical protein
VSQHVRLLYVPPNVFGMQLAVSLWKHSCKSLLYLPSHLQRAHHRRCAHRPAHIAGLPTRNVGSVGLRIAVARWNGDGSVGPFPTCTSHGRHLCLQSRREAHTNRSVHPLLRTYRSHAHCAQEGQYPGALQLHTSIVPSITRTSRSLKLAMSCSFWLASCRA